MTAKLTKYLYWSALALLIYMPFHIFLSQWLSTFTGGLDAWKVAKDVFLALATLLVMGLVWFKSRFSYRLFWTFVGGALAYLVIHLMAWAANPQIDPQAAALGTAYNCRLLAYVALGWGVGILLKDRLSIKLLFKIVIIVSSIVALLGILQYFLPKDLLTHFGYSLERGVKPAFFIDDKPDLPRIMSTLRDPNSLGAYLILPITLLWGAWVKLPKARLLLSGLLLLHGLALFLTFSRSAWVGAIIALSTYTLWAYKKQATRFIKRFWPFLLFAFCFLLFAGFSLRDQYVVQNYIFHSDENTRAELDSNEKHILYAQQGIENIANKPLGHGPGTAGIVSIQTDTPVIPENYFIQIGYEVGLQGLLVLLTLMWLVLRILFRRGNLYSTALIASFVGITFCNLLLHTWSNEAVAAQWWLLAGLLLQNVDTKKISKAKV